MDARNRSFLAVNVVGGVLVLGSYAYGIATHWGSAQALWGGIEGPMRAVYTVNMLPATAGYLLMFAFVLRTLPVLNLALTPNLYQAPPSFF